MMPVNLNKTETSLSPTGIVSLPLKPVTSLYLHVPFCRLKCRYCDFYSVASSEAADMVQFVKSAVLEAGWWTKYMGSGRPLSTVFFGGGTPTALPLEGMRDLIAGLREALPIAADAEWTIEANPATIDEDYCRMLLASGVNRLSMGAQSFDDGELRMLGRIHSAQDVVNTVRDAQQAGFSRLSIDLMYAVPGQTPGSWQRSLETALSLGISHISCYCLSLEEGTPMWSQTRSGKLPSVAEETQLEFMRLTRTWLRDHGLPPYEISNYAVPGEECRHNLVYWESGNYVGLGPGAASHVAGHRWRNTPDLRRYLDGAVDGRIPVSDVEQLDAVGRAHEFLMLATRCSSGLRWRRFEEVTGIDGKRLLGDAASRMIALGLMEKTTAGIRLTDDGSYVADAVIEELVRQVS